MLSNELIAVIVGLSFFAMLFGAVFKLFSPKMRSLINTQKLTVDEQLAFLEAAIMTLHIDTLKETSEEIAFRHAIKHTKWAFDAEKAVRDIRLKVLRVLQTRQDMDAYLNSIKEKISSDESAQTILLACTDLSDFGGSSGSFFERQFLAKLESVLYPNTRSPNIEI